MIEVKPILDSIIDYKNRITTFEVNVPLLTWVQLLTHRDFSRNAASNRAIPTKKLLQSANFIPEKWPLNDKGMSPSEFISEDKEKDAIETWEILRRAAIGAADTFNSLGVHKEIANRVLAPFIYIKGIITSTKWDNFITLRTHETTQYETRVVADKIKQYFEENKRELVPNRDMHLPYVEAGEEFKSLTDAYMISAARCARVSYMTHDGKRDLKEDALLSLRLLQDGHMSPFEHIALSETSVQHLIHHRVLQHHWENSHGNFSVGVNQFRKLIEPQMNAQAVIMDIEKVYGEKK